MNSTEQHPIPEKIPFLWKLAFLIFIIFGLFSTCSSPGTLSRPAPGEPVKEQVNLIFDSLEQIDSQFKKTRSKALEYADKLMPIYDSYVWKWRLADFSINLTFGLSMLIAGFGGYLRKPIACTLAVFVLVASIPWGVINYVRFAKGVAEIQKIDAHLAAMVQFSSGFQVFLLGGLLVIIHLILARHLWRRRHWFNK